MKKILALLFLFCFSKHYAQSEISKQVKEALNQKYADLVLDNKLLVVNHAASLSDATQQKINSELEKTGNVYQNAKLKGGRKGVVCVMIVDNTDQEIAFKKSIKNCFLIKASDIALTTSKTIIIDSEGTIVFDNVDASKIYSSVHSLITR